jgi:hypothetical protein
VIHGSDVAEGSAAQRRLDEIGDQCVAGRRPQPLAEVAKDTSGRMTAESP